MSRKNVRPLTSELFQRTSKKIKVRNPTKVCGKKG